MAWKRATLHLPPGHQHALLLPQSFDLDLVKGVVSVVKFGDRRNVALLMLLKSAVLCDLYLLTYIICPSETPCDAYLFLPFASIQCFNSRCYLKGGFAIEKSWTIIEGDANATVHDVLGREMRLKIFFEVGHALEMVQVPLVTIELVQEMRLSFFWSRPSFWDVVSTARHDIGMRNGIVKFWSRPSDQALRCCKFCFSR